MCFATHALTQVQLKPICFIYRGHEEQNKYIRPYEGGPSYKTAPAGLQMTSRLLNVTVDS